MGVGITCGLGLRYGFADISLPARVIVQSGTVYIKKTYSQSERTISHVHSLTEPVLLAFDLGGVLVVDACETEVVALESDGLDESFKTDVSE